MPIRRIANGSKEMIYYYRIQKQTPATLADKKQCGIEGIYEENPIWGSIVIAGLYNTTQ